MLLTQPLKTTKSLIGKWVNHDLKSCLLLAIVAIQRETETNGAKLQSFEG